MAYFDIWTLANDNDFRARVSSCFVDETDMGNPNPWVADNILAIASAPGFGDAYASAVLNGVAFPGRDQSVISDLQILSAVQARLATNPPADA